MVHLVNSIMKEKETSENGRAHRENVRVFVRIRPLLPGREIDSYAGGDRRHSRDEEDADKDDFESNASCVMVEGDERTVVVTEPTKVGRFPSATSKKETVGKQVWLLGKARAQAEWPFTA